MCMIALRPGNKGANIPHAVIDTAMNRHPDGFGLMWRDATGLHAKSWAPSGRKAFRKALKAVDRSGVEYAAHFRYATSGPKNAEMAHPYVYTDPDPNVGEVAVMHNGVITIAHDRNKVSDTHAFVHGVLANLPSRWWANPAIAWLVGESIGWSRLVIMTKDETANLQEPSGAWDGGIWYSSDHRPSKAWTGGTGITGASGTSYGQYASPATKAATAAPRDTRHPASGVKSAQQSYATFAEAANARSRSLVPYAQPDPWAAQSGRSTVIRTVDEPIQFRHAGHVLDSVKDITLDKDGDFEDAVICNTCMTIGSVYVIDGTAYIDMAHRVGRSEDDEDLLPVSVMASERR